MIDFFRQVKYGQACKCRVHLLPWTALTVEPLKRMAKEGFPCNQNILQYAQTLKESNILERSANAQHGNIMDRQMGDVLLLKMNLA